MSDQAESERTRNCTRPLYIATRNAPNKTMTSRTIQGIQSLFPSRDAGCRVSCRFRGDGASPVSTGGFKWTLAVKEQSFKVSKKQSFKKLKQPCNLRTWPLFY